jgi:RNA polymerase sigma-70 factor (ECF subfamily)
MRMNDEEKTLVEMVLAGRNDAFEPLVRPYRRAVLGLAYRLTRNLEDAKEVAQEALLRAYKYLGKFDTSRSFRNWLFQITANEARDKSGKGRRERGLLEEAAKATPLALDPEHVVRTAELRSGLLRFLEILSPQERRVFVLRDLEDLTVAETARTLGCSNVSVRVHLSTARRKIREAVRASHPYLENGR